MSNPQITIASIPLPDGVHIDLDPLDGTTHCLLALTGQGGVTVTVRLWVPEKERGDWARAVAMMRGR